MELDISSLGDEDLGQEVIVVSGQSPNPRSAPVTR